MAHRMLGFAPSATVVFSTRRGFSSSFNRYNSVTHISDSRVYHQPSPGPFRREARMVAEPATANKGPRQKKSKGSARREKKSSMSPGLIKALEKYEPVIGVEVHVQLSTRTKAYCNCSTKAARTPNVNICPVCMGMPGALPTVNSKAVEFAAKSGMAIGCEVSQFSMFDRKNYYYADTAKNYQITQDKLPIASKGKVVLVSSGKPIGITRLHMEEDSAKMSHEGAGAAGRLTDSTHSLIDFNRSGVPLIEIVSEPDMRTGAEAAEYGQELQRILRYVGSSDCNMQDGSLRCDVNVSIRPKGSSRFGTKVELKNLNSFSSAQKSVDFEIERQAALLDDGQSVQMETRTWDEKAGETKTMRVKEGLADYRYFPEPDLPPLRLTAEQLNDWRVSMPELPAAKRDRYQTEFGLSLYDASVLIEDFAVARYFEETISQGGDAKQAANWIMGDIMKVLKLEKLDVRMSKLTPQTLAEMIGLIDNGVISGKIAKDLVHELITQGGSPAQLVEERGLKLISDPAVIQKVAQQVLEENSSEVAAYKDGKTRLFGLFVGKTLAGTDGRGDPVTINRILKELLGSE